MCGIAGILALGKNQIVTDADSRVRRMTHALAHRGPDDEGIYASANIVLGHRRLSIIDLSAHGHQPMVRPDQASSIVFNGEIYNFKELAKKYSIADARSDTFVLQELIERQGVSALAKLRGFFTFANWDAPNHSLLIARDAVGKKPLYYTVQDGQFIFASELRALIASGLVRPILSKQGLAKYLSFYSLPSPQTMIEGVSTLPPGHTLRVDADGAIKIERWWRLADYEPRTGRPRSELVQTIREKVEEAVRYRLVSDVPVASFLSGGLDSNVVTGLMAQDSPAPIKSFTLGFVNDKPENDERDLARLSARAFGTDHHELTISASDVVRWLPDFFASMDSPTGDGLNSYLVSRATHEADPSLKVVISGVGGDELFLGYKKFRWLAKHPNIQRLVASVPRGVRGSLFRRLEHSTSKLQNAVRMLLEPSRTRILFSGDEVAELCTIASSQVCEWTDDVLNAHSLDQEKNASARLQRLDIENYLPSMLLRDLDVMTMSQSLEARAPFLDVPLIEFMQQVPLEDKAAGPSKSLLSEAFADLIPDELLTKPKTGFELPMSQWLRDGALNPYLTVLQQGQLRLIDDRHLNSAAVGKTVERFLKGRAHYLEVWAIIALEGWYRALMQYEQLPAHL